MRMYDIILKKRNKETLSTEEINFFVKGVTDSSIPDYQISAFLMAIYFSGLDNRETTDLTLAMAQSGDTVDLSSLSGITVDKHSTGGVGDKTTLIVAPIVASLGGVIAKMSGRGLGHTGGTVDKLESIKGFKTELSKEQFFDTVNNIGICVAGQSGNLAPADKKLYALRDVTATVDNIPLIASSIMSKKLAAGSQKIVLDVKTGSGAFMDSLEKSRLLAHKMVEIGNNANRQTVALITNMDIPLGNAVGNSLEVVEAVNTLNGNGPDDLLTVCTELSACMLSLVKGTTVEQCRDDVLKAIENKSALNKFIEMVEAQGGDSACIKDVTLFEKAKYVCDITSPYDGYISKMDTKEIGICAMILGAGRETKAQKIDHSAGIYIHKKTGDLVKKGEKLATLYTNDESKADIAQKRYLSSITFDNTQPPKPVYIYEIIK